MRQPNESTLLIAPRPLTRAGKAAIVLGLLLASAGGLGLGFFGQKGLEEYSHHRLDSAPYVGAAALFLFPLLLGIFLVHGQSCKPTASDTPFYRSYLRAFTLFLTALCAVITGILGERAWNEYSRQRLDSTPYSVGAVGFLLLTGIGALVTGRLLGKSMDSPPQKPIYYETLVREHTQHR